MSGFVNVLADSSFFYLAQNTYFSVKNFGNIFILFNSYLSLMSILNLLQRKAENNGMVDDHRSKHIILDTK